VVDLELPSSFNLEKTLESLDHAFQAYGGDLEYLEGMRRTVPGAAKLYGVRVPQLREIAKQIQRTYRSEQDGLLGFAIACWDQGSREHQLVALFLLTRLKLAPGRAWELGVRFLPEVSNWETCDQLCSATLGEALAKDPGYMDVLETWVDDPNFWIRRAALVAPVLLRRAKYPDEIALDLDKRTLAMSKRLINDPEKYIRKAIDWTIREVIRRRYELGRDWLFEMASQSAPGIARSTLKLASKKLSPDDQQHFLSLLGL
jgi:3-methyladenine DNA glycosylase AlkD